LRDFPLFFVFALRLAKSITLSPTSGPVVVIARTENKAQRGQDILPENKAKHFPSLSSSTRSEGIFSAVGKSPRRTLRMSGTFDRFSATRGRGVSTYFRNRRQDGFLRRARPCALYRHFAAVFWSASEATGALIFGAFPVDPCAFRRAGWLASRCRRPVPGRSASHTTRRLRCRCRRHAPS